MRQAPAPEQTKQKPRWGWPSPSVLLALPWLAWCLWLVGQLARDATWLTGLCFYIPSPALLLGLVIGATISWRKKRRRAASLLLAPTLLVSIFVLGIENRLIGTRPALNNEGTSSDPTLRLVHWNVFSGKLGWDSIQDTLRATGADLCILSEVPDELNAAEFARSFGEEYTAVRRKNLAVIARGELEPPEWLHNEGRFRVFGVCWHSPAGTCRVVVADLPADLLVKRDPLLRRVAQSMIRWRADLVAGDFNAPRRSRALCPLPRGFVHAYDVAGRGYSATWPVPAPLYAIDHCILGERVQALRYDLQSSLRSDHRMQVLDFELRAPAPPAEPAPAPHSPR